MKWVVIVGYFGAMGIVTLFALQQLNLTRLYLRNRLKTSPLNPLDLLPRVTVQLPIFNEKYVVARLIDSVCGLDYPKDLMEIQLLDDSTDETSTLIAEKIIRWRNDGLTIHHIQRADRIGYKAGALQHGLSIATGSYIAIFDADFLPNPQFLKETLPHFTAEVGMVQTKWAHLNQDFSLLTRMQAFGLDAHFSIEQKGRASSGMFMNFNGTAGVWRKTCIEESGGWQSDTLTEDLDLSYRAQLRGWKFRYLEATSTPSELPVLVPAVKSQQYRWNKGAAETVRKHLIPVLFSKLTKTVKFHAAAHLLNSSVFVFLFIAAILSVPLLFVKSNAPDLKILFDFASLFILGFIAIGIFYWVSAKSNHPDKTWRYFMSHLPIYISFSLGLTLHNTIAIVEGYLGIKTPFIRTPKFNIVHKKDSWTGNVYLISSLSTITVFEFLLALYFVFGIFSAFYLMDFGLIFFHLMLAAGFGSIAILSMKSLKYG